MPFKRFSGAAASTDKRIAERRRAPARSRQRMVPVAGSAIPPLHWWRRLPADAFTGYHVQVLRRAFVGIGMVGEPRWADAVRGHPAATVGVALRVMKEHRPLTPVVDLTMSTVLIAAIAGDLATIAVLVTMIERMGAGTEKDELKHSWLNRQRRAMHGRDAISSAVSGARTCIVSGD